MRSIKLNRLFFLFIIFTSLFSDRALLAQSGIPLKYGEPLGIQVKKTGVVYIFQAIPDPLKFSSKAYFIVYRSEDIKEVAKLLHDQEKSGPFFPITTKELDMKLFTVQREGQKSKSSTKVEFEDFSFSWYPGNEKMCWLTDIKSDEILVRLLFKSPPQAFAFDQSDFTSVQTYVDAEQERIVNEAVRRMETRQ